MQHKISLTTHFIVANNIQKYKKVWLQMNTNRGICPFAIKSPSPEKLPNTSVNTIHLMGFLQNINFLTTNTLKASILPKQWSTNRYTATKILPNYNILHAYSSHLYTWRISTQGQSGSMAFSCPPLQLGLKKNTTLKEKWNGTILSPIGRKYKHALRHLMIFSLPPYALTGLILLVSSDTIVKLN